jgi:GntR family transcriptional regulator
MLFHANPSSGVPVYLQLMEQIKHAIEMGALRRGEQLPTIRKVAEDLVVNPNTVARAYRELEHAGIIELKHGTGAFVRHSAAGPSRSLRRAQTIVAAALGRLVSLGLSEEEIRRLMESELALLLTGKGKGRMAVHE